MERDTPQSEIKQPDLEASIQVLHSVMEDDPTSEKPLDELIKVEEALRLLLEIKELSKETKAEIDRVLMGLTGRTISAFLDEIHEKAFRAMETDSEEAKDDIEGYLEKLKIVYRKIEKVILIPDQRNGIFAGSGKGVEKKDLHTNKLQHLLELLRVNEIYTDDICIVIGENTPNMMREGSYLYIEIPKVKRTVLLHLGYGEASFVLYDIYDRAMVFAMTKEKIQEKLGATKVEYTERDLMKWGTEILKALKLNEAILQPKVNIENYDKRLFYIEEIKKLYPTPEELIKLSQDKKKNLKINGNGLVFLATLLIGQSGLRPVHSDYDMAVLAKEIYGEGHKVIERELWGKTEWIEEIKKVYPTPESFMQLTPIQRRSLILHEKKLIYIANIIAGKNELKVLGKNQDLAMLAREIYGEGHDIIECEFWDKERWINEIKKVYPTPEKYMDLTSKERGFVKLFGKGLQFIRNIIIDEQNLKILSRNRDFAVMARAIYGVGHMVIECEFWDIGMWIFEMRTNFPNKYDFLKLNQSDRKAIKILGRGFIKLARLITEDFKIDPIAHTKDMQIFAEAIYGENDNKSDNN